MTSVQASGSSESLDRDPCTAAAVAAAMLLPLSDALNFLGKLANKWRAFGEKLSNSFSFYKRSSGLSGSRNISTSNRSASSFIAKTFDGDREDISGAHPTDPSNYGSQGQQQGHPNGLEFSIAEFLAVRVWRRKVPKSSMPDTSFDISVDAKVASKAAPEQSRTGADSSPSDLLPLLCGSCFAGDNDYNLRVVRSPLPYPRQPQPRSKGLPQSKRSRSTDKTLVLDMDETLIRARRELTPDDRFDFIVTLPPKHQMLEQHKLAGNLALNPRGTSGAIFLGDDGRAPDTRTTAASRSLIMQKLNVCSGKPRKNYGSRNGRRIYVEKRPHLQKFLETVSCHFEIVVFTAARADFANAVLEEIDPGRQMVDHILSRESCARLSKSQDKCGDACDDGDRETKFSWPWRRGGRNTAGPRSKRRSAMVKDLGILGRPLSKVSCRELKLFGYTRINLEFEKFESVRGHLLMRIVLPISSGPFIRRTELCTSGLQLSKWTGRSTLQVLSRFED